MNPFLNNKKLQGLANTIEKTAPRPHHSALLLVLANMIPDSQFRHVLTVGGWYHSGGVLTPDGDFLSRDMESWLDSEMKKYNDDYQQFIQAYTESDLIVTRHSGQTHYFSFAYGSAPEEFLQLEVEELYEVMDRYLIDPERPPEDYEELVSPDHYTKLDAQPVGNPSYRFVRLVDMREVVEQQNVSAGEVSSLARFMAEWSQSRAAKNSHFCEHWAITGIEQNAGAVTHQARAIPVSAHKHTLKQFQWDLNKVGAGLSKQIQDFDRAAGYPGAWYFHFIVNKHVPCSLETAIKNDLDSGYNYLAEKDLALFKKLESNPYRLM